MKTKESEKCNCGGWPHNESCPVFAILADAPINANHSQAIAFREKQAAKHTPGPWEITESGSDIEIMVPDGKSIAHVFNEPTMLADASLIAAAPELLDVAKEAAQDLALLLQEKDLPGNDLAWDRLASLRAAIAKAEGK